MAKKDLKSPNLYINRELSWLQFNQRVLEQACSESLSLADRLKFLAIVASNLDEFFMIRVAGLMQQRDSKKRKRDISGMTATQQLRKISQRAHKMIDDHSAAIREVLEKLQTENVWVVRNRDWNDEQRKRLRRYFTDEVLPVLTPLAVQDLKPAPLLPGRQINVALTVINQNGKKRKKGIITIPVPGLFPRFIEIPSHKGTCVALLEDIIAEYASLLCEQEHIVAISMFRITRDADVAVQEDEAGDLIGTMEEAILSRRRRSAVRLEVAAGVDDYLKKWLMQWLGLSTADVYDVGELLDATCLMQLSGRYANGKNAEEDWHPLESIDLKDSEDIWQTLQNRDVLLTHPYESFDSVVNLIQKAAEDPSVIAIKQTLYRTSSDSPIIAALERAADKGKEVTVLVELKARFDEERNINWARRLEDAGCHVIYGIAGLKTHAKALLIVRREEKRLRRYVHLATGNYNDKTARLYSDIGLFTTDNTLASDVSAFFNLLTGVSEVVGWSDLVIAPTEMKSRFIELIEREIAASTPGRPGRIIAKVNSLEDREVCEALYRASQAGVNIQLNVRGICCLKPGVKGASETIEVRSIVDRYLEHARIYYFANGGRPEVYLSSADWMRRNLDKRLELLFPVKDAKLRDRVIWMLKTYFKDNVQAWEMRSDGNYERVNTKGKSVRAQKAIYQEFARLAKESTTVRRRFRPIRKPK